MKPLVELLLLALGVYGAIGAVFAGWMHVGSLRRIDPEVAGAGVGFRLAVTPGLIALWPMMAWRWSPIASGKIFADRTEAPVSPRNLRTVHRLVWQALAVAVPLLVAVALASRPNPGPATSLPADERQLNAGPYGSGAEGVMEK